MKITKTVPRQDVLLCLLHLGAHPGGEWPTVTDLVEAHYGQTLGTARQGRRQAMRNIMFGLFDEGYVLSKKDGDEAAFQLTPRAMRRLHPSQET